MKNIFKSRESRGKVFAAITAVGIILLFGLNLLVTYFGLHKTIFVDMTPEGFYTLTDAMKEECAYIEDLNEPVKITFCADPDTLVGSENTRLLYFMALELDALYDNFVIEDTVNVTYNPTAVSQYKATSLTKITSTDVIISYGDRYRIVGADSFWTTVDGEFWSFNGEYKLASIIKSVTAKDRPSAYFVTGNGETYYDVNNKTSEGSLATEDFCGLLQDRGLEVKTINLSECDEIPDDCVLLIINNPTSDYVEEDADIFAYDYVSPTEKIDRYLVKDRGSVMVAIDYKIAKTDLPVLTAFLFEWGFDISDSRVVDESTSLDEADTIFVGQYDSDTESYGYGIYGDFVDLQSAPSFMMENTGYVDCSFGTGTSIPESGTYSVSRNYAPFLFSTDKAIANRWSVGNEDFTDLDRKDEKLTLVAVTTRLAIDDYQAEYTYSYIMCANSPDFLSGQFVGNPSYANYDVLSALIQNMVRTDEYASIELGGTSLNSPSIGGKPFVDTKLYAADDVTASTTYSRITTAEKNLFTVAVMIIPFAIAVVGVVVMIKRKFL